MTKSRDQLIKYYEEQLEKVKLSYKTNTNSNHMNERNMEYVKQAENDLNEVKEGRQW